MVATSASAPAAAAPLPTGAAARLSLPPSLAAVGGSREAAAASVPHLSAAAAQHPQQPQLIPVEPRLLARSVSYSFPAASSSMTIR